MSTLNIINAPYIDSYLCNFCGENELLRLSLCAALSNIIKKHAAAMVVVEELPDGAPSWLIQKWDTQEVWHKFDERADVKLPGRVFGIVSWLEYMIAHEVEWLKHVDEKGRPLKLLQASSFDHLETIMGKENAKIALKRKNAAEKQLLAGNMKDEFETVMTFENGYSIVRLKTDHALDLEGDFLEHCIGDGDYDYCLSGNVSKFYSLRDAKGLPCVSMRVDRDVIKKLTEIRGRRNSYPKNKFIPYVATFCKEGFIDLADAFSFDEGFRMLREEF
ncbi:MAG: PcfJ domain-containing protein [Alphaproteobacteria bacterium]|nr:PcfJ domain-containing protein [Alphaproteobacteria bacterium]